MLNRRLAIRTRRIRRRLKRFVVHHVLHADDPPHRLALGMAIGVFVTFTPTVGAQMLLVVAAAWLLRANKAVGLPIVWISNPATVVPLFYPCYVIGRTILGLQPIGRAWWNELSKPPMGWWPAMTFYWDKLTEIAEPLWLGCLIVATCTSVPMYFLSYYAIRAYRLRRWGQVTRPADW